MANSYGLSFKKSSLLEPYKSHMKDAFMEHPIEAIEYAILDVIVLYNIMKAVVNSFNDLLVKAFKITDSIHFYNLNNIPMSIGSLVYSMYKKYFYLIVLKNDPSLTLGILSQGILWDCHRTYSQNLERFTKLK